MANWLASPERSWSEIRGSLSGFGRGTGPYGLSYVIDTASPPILNGRVSARIRLAYTNRAVGAGVVCRADDVRSFAALYVTSDPRSPGLFSVRLAAFKYGTAVANTALTTPFELTDSELQLSLQFFSGELQGEVVSGANSAVIEHLVPERPFAGHSGLVRFYDVPVFAREIHIEEIQARPVLPEDSEKPSHKHYEFDVFISHGKDDDELIAQVLERFKQAGIKYWIDSEQLTFGDQAVAKIEDGLRSSRFVVAALSEGMKSGWSRSEYGPILYREFSGDTSRRVIPLSLDGSESERAVPILLSDKVRADFTDQQGFKAFLDFLKHPPA
jgi:TIR domain-containing protein